MGDPLRGRDKGTPVERLGRKASGLPWVTTMPAGLPNDSGIKWGSSMCVARHSFVRSGGIVFLSLSLAACADFAPLEPRAHRAANEASLAQVALTDDIIQLHVGETSRIRLPEADEYAESPRWSTDDPSVVAVDQAGHVEARTVGSTTVTVTIGDQVSDVLVTVLPAAASDEVDQ